MEDVLGLGHDWARGVAIQSDGKIVVAGDSNDDFALARYNTNGSLDTTFDGNGKVNTPVAPGSSRDEAYAVAIQADGKIVAGGIAEVVTFDDDYALARYNTNGSLDTSFDGDGKVTTPIASGGPLPKDVVNALAIQPSDGKIVAAGESAADFSLARYNPNGSLDTSFDGDGKVTTAGAFLRAHALALRPGGEIVAAGAAGGFGVVRYKPDGSLDTSFDADGRLVTPIAAGGSLEVARGVVIQPDDKIVAAGYANMEAPDNLEFALVRYKATPTLAAAAQPPSGPAGGSFSAEATVTGGSNPTGQVEFKLYGPTTAGNCTGQVVHTEIVQLSLTGTASTTTTVSQAGHYEWTASYLGDASNASASTTCGQDPLTVGPPTAVALASFRAVVARRGVLLRFRTAFEAQTLGFNIYRQQRGKLTRLNLTLISSIARGTTGGHTYSWLDRRAPRGTGALRYRLQAVSLDGTRSWLGSAVAR
jgi:uncharacterized delta-60 repeat protein